MAETVESPVRGDAHAVFGERPAETGRWQHRYRAAGRLNHPGAQLRFTDTDGLRLTAFINQLWLAVVALASVPPRARPPAGSAACSSATYFASSTAPSRTQQSLTTL